MSKDLITLYKYIPLDYAVETIKNHRLYLSNGTNFNDPFELIVKNEKTGQNNNLTGLHILCLTNSYRNKLIWSYYTNAHSGICLTVKIPRQIVKPVCYSTRRVFSDSNIDTILSDGKYFLKKCINPDFSGMSTEKKIAYVKDSKWKYEKEYRIVFDSADEYKLIYDNGKWFFDVKIVNVYFGVNFDKNDSKIIESIKEVCASLKIKTSQMILSPNDYSINVKK